MEDATDRIDPLPPPSACLDGIQRHLQQYEQSISRLQFENNELRERLTAAIQQLDLYRMSPGQPAQQQAPFTYSSNTIQQSKVSSPAPQTVVQPPAPLQQIPKARKLVLHSRQIAHITLHKGLLLTASKDGTARIWREDGASLHTFRADGPLTTASYFDGLLILASKQKKIFIHQTSQAGSLIPFADVLDLNQSLIRNAADASFLTVPQPATTLAYLNNRVFIFGSGFFTCAEITNTAQLIKTQHFTEQLDQKQPLIFTSAISFQSCIFVSLKEKFIKNGQFLNLIPDSLVGTTRTGARIMQINNDFSITAHTLQINCKVELTPIDILGFMNFIICVFSNSFASLNVQNGKFVEFGETLQEIACSCFIDQGKMFIGCEKGLVLVYGIDVSAENIVMRKEKVVAFEDLGCSISSIYVSGGMMVAGGVSGEVVVKGWQQ
ncbi:hypothetical protein SS50377_25397 [Spironucleus salmonicida]|uniref:WD domain, G-beta repeat-containing protein n=1 Tax=Spironucleus salmonicida TaxID=348837 RepID=V6LK64_9EUKA|nr:hypothetical protein SS50377_25397 [Spironucleus salmonicida]|eukprot:EST44942.1 hypothetical protein SS50377_14959 [Spironucleus salmonicida]